MGTTYRNLNIAVPSEEWEVYKRFFDARGGFTKFVRESMEKAGFRDKESLRELARRVREANLQETQALDHLSGEGIE